jgi:hypothetical protein
MSRATLAILALVGFGCVPAGSYQGKLVDAISGAPVPDVRLLAKSGSTDMTCMAFDATTGPDGSFTIPKLCAGETYLLEAGMKTFVLEGAGPIDGAVQATGAVTIKVWKNPGAGVYLLKNDGTWDKLGTASDVESKKILDSEEKAFYPAKLPITYTAVAEGQYLMISGDRNIDKLIFQPVIESGTRIFGTSEEQDEDEPWSYIGIEFQSDTEFQRKTVEPDPAKRLEIEQGEAHVVYLPAGAVPAGRYALWEDGGRRMYAVEF